MRNLTSSRLWKLVARVMMAVVFIFMSITHFTATDIEMKLIPPSLPLRREAVYISGVFEFLGGIGLLFPNRQVQRFSSWGLIALLVAIFPANIYHAVAGVEIEGLPVSPVYLWGRLPFQPLMIVWALWCTSGNSNEVTKKA